MPLACFGAWLRGRLGWWWPGWAGSVSMSLAELVPGDLLLVLLVVSPCYFLSGAYWMMNGEQ